MFYRLSILIIVFGLSSCGATIPSAYQKDRKPSDRTEYNGIGGMIQHQKDQSYIRSKTLCDRATRYYNEGLNDLSNSKDKVEELNKDMMDACF
ncbi:MAG: hypothetical protein COA86_14015 [Kangiella sp.]|nr:MAG: hypothetical protein COA86_14015 [Kangiella sp.]